MFHLRPIRPVMILTLCLSLLSGCATTTAEWADPADPLEGMNRSIYQFNETLDRYLLKPVAEGYADYTPAPLQRGVGNFFANLTDLRSAANNLLQMKIGRGLSDISRVLINTTVGVGGVLDVATSADIPRYDEDFGQTLGYWGIEPGPYLVLPFLGPSSLRDTFGLVGDWYADPVTYIDPDGIRIPLKVLNLVDQRAQLLGASNMLETAAIDPYSFTRNAYLQRRLSKVYDGNPPVDFEDFMFE